MPHINEITLAKKLIRFPSVTPKDAGTISFLAKELKKLGFDPSKSQDPVYFLNGDKYEEINEELYKSIQSGNVRF